jgi:Pectate lyase superfamily protein/Right handed beta helix region
MTSPTNSDEWSRTTPDPSPLEDTGIAPDGLGGAGDGAGGSTSIRRKQVLMGMAASLGLAFANAARAPAAAAVASGQLATFAQGISVASMGATGDGATDDTAAVRAAIVAAAGAEVYFPAGAYVLDGLLVDMTAWLQLDPAATLMAKPNSPIGWMIAFTGRELTIRGGTIDGNKANQSGRPCIVAGGVQQGKTVDVADVHFQNAVKSALYLSTFGGLVSVERCLFTGQAEHDGIAGHSTQILTVVSGQVGVKGHVRFNHNRAIGTNAPALPGGSPGGVFLAPSSTDPTVGNMTTLEAVGNYFWGYGQNCGGNDISPFHMYHSTLGARIIGNYFEECGFAAISAKSVTDFICTDNVFVGGAISPQNTSSEGVITYAPGYFAGSLQRPRGVITGNIIENPGGQSTALRQNGISVHGSPTSHGTDIIVSGNVINGGGVGIEVQYVDDIVISGNIIQGGTGAAAGSQGGIYLYYAYGDVLIADNVVKTLNGNGCQAPTGVNTARVTVQGNKFKQTGAGSYSALLCGMAFLKLSGNEFNAPVGVALDVRADGTANKVGLLTYDLTNTIVAGTVSFSWPGILRATGQLRAKYTPLNVVIPGEVGTTYHQSDGAADGILWVALGTTSSSWAKVLKVMSSGTAAANRLLGMTYDPVSAVLGQASAAAGALSLAKVLMPGGGAVSKLWFQITKGGTGLVSGRCFLGVYSSTGALIGQSADMAATFAATGTKAIALAAPTAAQTQGAEVFVALLWNGTTGPQLRGIDGVSMANIGVSAVADYRFTMAGSGLTALPTTRPTQLASLTAPWFGVA